MDIVQLLSEIKDGKHKDNFIELLDESLGVNQLPECLQSAIQFKSSFGSRSRGPYGNACNYVEIAEFVLMCFSAGKEAGRAFYEPWSH